MSSRTTLLILVLLAAAGVTALLITGSGSDGPVGPAGPDGTETRTMDRDESGPTGGRRPGEDGEVTGRVVDAVTGEAIAGAIVKLGKDGELTTAENGGFSLDAGAPGELVVAADGYYELRRNVDSGADLGDLELRPLPVLAVKVLDTDSRPVPGASVRVLDQELYETGSWWEGPGPDQILAGIEILERGGHAPGERATAGEDGVARIRVPGGGTWFASAAAKGFAGGESSQIPVADSGETATEIVLEPSASITGRVIDLGRKPAANTRIIAIPWTDASRFPYAITREVTTGEDGAFTVSGLSAGTKYALFAVTGDGQLGLGLQIEAPKEGVEIVCGPRFNLEGTVVDDETGEALSGVRIFTVLGHAVSEDDGRYELEGMVKSPFFRYVWLRKEGYQNAQETVEIGRAFFGGPTITMNFRMSKVRPATVRVTVRDTSGRPVSGATVEVLDWGEDEPVATGTTDAAGEASIGGVPPGGVIVHVVKEGHVQVDVSAPGAGPPMASPSRGEWVQAPEGEEVAVEMVMSSTTRITGTVLDREGNALEGVEVTAGEASQGLTDGKGNFVAADLPRNHTCTVTFTMDGFAPQSRTIVPGETTVLDVVLSPAASIAGTVVDEAGNPVGGVKIRIDELPQYSSPAARTGPDGRFRIEGLVAGSYSLFAVREGFAPKKFPALSLGDGQAKEGVRLEMPLGVEVTLSLADSGGKIVAGAIYVYGPLDAPESERLNQGRPVDPDEPAVVRLLPGRYRIAGTPNFRAEDSGAVEIDREISGDGEIQVILAPNPLRALIRPLLPAGEKIGSMRLERDGEPSITGWFSDARPDGVYPSIPLLPGRYRLQIWRYREDSPGMWFGGDERVVSPGETVIEVDLRPE